MKIFIGTVNVTDAPALLKEGFRKLGHDAEVGLINYSHKFYPAIENDVDVPGLIAATKAEIDDSGMAVYPPAEFFKIVERYDLFVFIASYSLMPRLCDLPLLQQMGKKVICYQMGSELRHELTGVQFWKVYGHEFPLDAYRTCRDENGKIVPWWRGQACMHTFVNKLYNTRMAERYATTIFSSPPCSNLGVRPYMGMQLPMDADKCTFRIPRNRIPLVVHAPSNRAVKRSDIILNTLLELKEEGVPFRLCLLENRPNAEVLRALSEADVLVDQIFCAALGRLALEGLASGCAVLSGNSEAVPWPPQRPAVSIRPSTVKERLREVLTNPMLRTRLAAEGREYIEKGYHSPEGAAQAILDAIHREENGDFDYYPTVFTDTARAVKEEPVPSFLRTMTLDILKQHGTHPDTDLDRLSREGFLPVQQKLDVPRWNLENLHRVGPWNWCSRRIPKPEFENMYIQD